MSTGGNNVNEGARPILIYYYSPTGRGLHTARSGDRIERAKALGQYLFIIIPLQAGDCTLREAVIISSVLVKNSIPMLHSAAALLKIAEMDYNGANSIFLRALLDKKYALPYRVVDAVVFHFLK